MPSFQPFSPLATTAPDFQGFGGSKYEIAKSPFASGNSIQGGSAVANPGLPVQSIVQGIAKAAEVGLQAYSFVNTLSAISDMKSGIRSNATRSREIVREKAQFQTETTELAAFRTLRTQTAQASAGGFAGASQSTLALQNRVETDKDRVLTQINKSLDDSLAEIQRQESAALKRARGLKTKAIVGFATSMLGNFS